MKNLFIRHLIPIIVFAASLLSCNKPSQVPTGDLELLAVHKVGQEPLETNKMIYTNAAGNNYLVTEVQWFISRLSLTRPDGSKLVLNNGEPVYFDSNIPATLSQMFSGIPAGTYNGISFVFGLDEAMNKSLKYTNPPESFMFWPDYLGGGYHYMKLNGKWLNNNGLLEPFNFHLGIGQIYDSAAPKAAMVDMNQCCKHAQHCEGYQPPQKTLPVVGFIHNDFEVNIPAAIVVEAGKTTALQLQMDIDQWFREPHVYDHNHWGGSIMQQQNAMKLGCENGHNVFSLKLTATK
ncbi:MAG: hypothetical protein IPM52_00680 [Bacteroidetes bacterium]|nr:hypothetical protein [Bacteroidota bacterium]